MRTATPDHARRIHGIVEDFEQSLAGQFARPTPRRARIDVVRRWIMSRIGLAAANPA